MQSPFICNSADLSSSRVIFLLQIFLKLNSLPFHLFRAVCFTPHFLTFTPCVMLISHAHTFLHVQMKHRHSEFKQAYTGKNQVPSENERRSAYFLPRDSLYILGLVRCNQYYVKSEERKKLYDETITTTRKVISVSL